MKIWLLTKECNDYNQYGEYFVAVFANKPTSQQLSKLDVPEERIDHVLDGGGRVNYEDKWFNLERITAK